MQVKKNSVVELDLYANETADRPVTTIEIAEITGVNEDGSPQVLWSGSPGGQPVAARSQIKVTEQDIHRSCTLAFAGGDRLQPIVMGLLYRPDVDNDAPTIIQSDDVIILQSGASRIELHADGRINLQGMQINSQAYGPHHIKGASIKIN